MTTYDRTWRMAQVQELLDFALQAVCPEGGFGWLDLTGNVDRSRNRPLYITCRMTHVAAIGTVLGHPGCAAALDHGVTALTGLFHDDTYGGWYTAVDWDGQPVDDRKGGYPHAFVILAASSAVTAGCGPAEPLLREGLATAEAHFWDEAAGSVVDTWDRRFTKLEPYRGANANMHTVEAYLAASEALAHLGDPGAAVWRERAVRIADRFINHSARANGWRLPEHYDPEWRPLLDYNEDHPADQFRPYGATPGHGLEWARLVLQAGTGLPDPWPAEAALALYDRAVADAWAVDGADGFVYTTNWDGTPVVHERLRWVVAEAIGAGVALQAAGLKDTTADVARWWAYADRYLIDRTHGSWFHELDRHNRLSATIMPGKPDIYHAIQALLLPDLPLAPAIVPALAREG